MIVLFGPAGAGKTVQGQILAKNNGWVWLSVGQVLRESHDNSVMQTMNDGHLAPTKLVDQVISDALSKLEGNSRIVLDGFPRQLDQAQWLMNYCEKNSRTLSAVLVLDVPENEIIERLSLRGRSDDSRESIAERLHIYESQMNPILEYFDSENVLVAHIDGVGTMQEVSDRINDKLSEVNIK